MKYFHNNDLNYLTAQAKKNPRLRQHSNIHKSYEENCQRLFNALEPSTYIRPHRHYSDPRDELLIALRGLMVLVAFDDQGAVNDIFRFGSREYSSDIGVGVEVASSTWHTVVALTSGSVLLEVKPGPFNPNQPKDFARWAPEEGSDRADSYLQSLKSLVGG